ncbi:MFS transporter [Candidatus Aerophobetes bacterium]|nr:MFS transporter [Candidatus Aerophobetes bacterium]
MEPDKKIVCQQKNSRKLLRVSFLGHFFNDVYWFIIPLMLPSIKAEFNLTYTQSGLLLTSYTLIGAFGSLVSGYLGDRTGRRFMLSWGFFIASLALVLCALSSNYWQFFLILILFGVGISVFHPSMVAVLSNSFTRKRGTILGLFQLWGVMGAFSAVLVISFLTKIFPGWRGILLVLSIPGFVFAPVFFKSLKPLLANQSSITYINEKKNNSHVSFSREKKITPLAFVTFLIANTLFIITIQGVINFIPTYLVEAKSFSLTFAGYAFSIVIAGGFFGAIASGKASDKLSPLTALKIFVAFGGPLIIIITLLESSSWLIIFLAIYGISYSGVWAPQQAYLAENTPQHARGGVYGLIFFLIAVVGAIAPGITGFIADQFGLSSALKIITIPVFISLALLFSLKRYPSFFLSCVTFFSG